MKRKILSVVCLCISSSVYAGGYRVALQGDTATGMGHAGVALSENAETVFFNPAAMASLSAKRNFSTGLSLIDSVNQYQNAETNTTAESDNPLGTPAYLYITQKYNQQLSFGFGFYTPFGNTVDWPDDWTGSHLVNSISLKTMYFQPTVSYKHNEMFSVGLGVSYVLGSMEFNRNLSTSLVDADGERSDVTIQASNIPAWAYNLGVLVKPLKELSVGMSYRSEVTLKARGEEADFEHVPSSLQSVYYDTTFDGDLVLPAELSVGFAYKTTSKTTLVFDINRTFWSAYEALDLTFNNSVGLSHNPRNYKDVNVYRIGLQQRLSNTLALRIGAYYDESPIQEGYFSPETPRNDSIGLTLGGSYAILKDMEVTFSYLYLMFDEFSGSYDYYNQSGTNTSFGSDYKSAVHSIGFGFNYRF